MLCIAHWSGRFAGPLSKLDDRDRAVCLPWSIWGLGLLVAGNSATSVLAGHTTASAFLAVLMTAAGLGIGMSLWRRSLASGVP